MAKSNITKVHVGLLIFNLMYLLMFAYLFSGNRNYEFLMYTGVLIFFILLISLLHLRFNFNIGVLLGLTAWGILHMLGGHVLVNGNILYAYQLIPGFLRFDQFVHMFGFGFATLFTYYLIKPNLNKNAGWTTISILLVFIGMGIGALNEIIEFVAVLTFPETNVGGYTNTMMDVVYNTIGSILAVIYINLRKRTT